jgi:hypothetical protein
MLSSIRSYRFVCVALLSALPTLAQQTPQTPTAPVPPAISNAKRVFISNTGGDSGLFPHPFSGTTDRAYNQFYAAVQGWARYELVNAPEDADLVFELQLVSPTGPGNPNKQKGAPDPVPMFRLNIVDRKTHYTLWALTESIEVAFLQKTHDHNFDQALVALTEDLKKLATPPSTTP